MTLVQGGDNDALLKLNSPNKYACAYSCGFTNKARNKLSVKLD